MTADSATCQDCLAELLDPADRRYRYPFINCTNCGPRFTIVTGVPYDRSATTMAAFQMCDECEREYHDPADRRFHAQPNACPRCGPRMRLVGAGGERIRVPGAVDPVDGAARRLADGLIVAIKGIGGFHLACDAANERGGGEAPRPQAPGGQAVCADGAQRRGRAGARRARRGGAARRSSRRSDRSFSPRVGAARPSPARVAPGAPELGVMLPYTPLHHLLLADFGVAAGDAAVLVMTSGNLADEPIAYEDEDALERLARIADLFLVHDRPIHSRTDDSVLRVVRSGGPRGRRCCSGARAATYRGTSSSRWPPRARSSPAAPSRRTPSAWPRRAGAWVGHHIGDLEHFAALQAFRVGVDHFERLFAVDPAVVAHDLHPGYLSTQYALEREGVEHRRPSSITTRTWRRSWPSMASTGPAVGAIFDGTGYGLDGTVWGGELLVGDLSGFERVGRLWPVRLPGGAAAIREPWRMTFAWLAESLGQPSPRPSLLHGVVDERRWAAMAGVIATRRCRRSPRAWAGCSTRWRRCAGWSPRPATRARPPSSSRRPQLAPGTRRRYELDLLGDASRRL